MELDYQTTLTKIKEISHDLCNNKLEPFHQSLEEINVTSTSLSKQHFGDTKRGYLKKIYDNIQPSLQVKVNNTHRIMERHLENLQNKRLEIAHLSKILDEKNIECDNKKKCVLKSKRHCETYEQKLDQLQNSKDCIKTYKLLTKTHFSYKKGSTTGYLKPKDPINFEVFDFTHSQVTEEEITQKIWILLENVSKKDIKKLTSDNKKIVLS